jgi:tetratricopeptide (TPR) repeat protein
VSGVRDAVYLLAAIIVLTAIEAPAQTHIAAPGGLAAQSISNSPIQIGKTPEQERLMIEVYVRQIVVAVEERGKAEARASELAAQLNVTQTVVIGFFRILGEQDVPLEQIGLKLGEIAAKHRALMDRWSVLDMADAATAKLAADARAAIDAGRYDEADLALLRASEQETEGARQAEQLAHDAQQAAERRWLRAAEADEKRGDLAMTRLRYLDAAKHFASAAKAIPAARHAERRKYLEKEAGALHEYGDERGDNEVAFQAIERYRTLLSSVDRITAPVDWAKAQYRLGNALATLGERDVNTARLEEAAAAYREASEEWTRQREPLEWAKAQNSLGTILNALGQRTGDTARLEEAVAAFRAALREGRRDLVPVDWAMTQNNLGEALRSLGHILISFGNSEIGKARLEEAVVAYRAALEEFRRTREPLYWAASQNNLGAALTELGELESGTKRLEEGMAAYRAALQEYTRERVPLKWALMQNNLGNALSTLGVRDGAVHWLEEAVVSHRNALEEFSRKRDPLQWAITQYSLGRVLYLIGAPLSDTARLEEAEVSFRAALEERRHDRAPRDWADTQCALGMTLWALGERERGTARLEEALGAFDLCLTVAEASRPAASLQSIHDLRKQLDEEISQRRLPR